MNVFYVLERKNQDLQLTFYSFSDFSRNIHRKILYHLYTQLLNIQIIVNWD